MKGAINTKSSKIIFHAGFKQVLAIVFGIIITAAFLTNYFKPDSTNSNKEIVFYSSIDDLSQKIKFYAKNDKPRIEIAKNGKKKYFKLFNEKRISKYIVDISLGKKYDLF